MYTYISSPDHPPAGLLSPGRRWPPWCLVAAKCSVASASWTHWANETRYVGNYLAHAFTRHMSFLIYLYDLQFCFVPWFCNFCRHPLYSESLSSHRTPRIDCWWLCAVTATTGPVSRMNSLIWVRERLDSSGSRFVPKRYVKDQHSIACCAIVCLWDCPLRMLSLVDAYVTINLQDYCVTFTLCFWSSISEPHRSATHISDTCAPPLVASSTRLLSERSSRAGRNYAGPSAAKSSMRVMSLWMWMALPLLQTLCSNYTATVLILLPWVIKICSEINMHQGE